MVVDEKSQHCMGDNPACEGQSGLLLHSAAGINEITPETQRSRWLTMRKGSNNMDAPRSSYLEDYHRSVVLFVQFSFCGKATDVFFPTSNKANGTRKRLATIDVLSRLSPELEGIFHSSASHST